MYDICCSCLKGNTICCYIISPPASPSSKSTHNHRFYLIIYWESRLIMPVYLVVVAPIPRDRPAIKMSAFRRRSYADVFIIGFMLQIFLVMLSNFTYSANSRVENEFQLTPFYLLSMSQNTDYVFVSQMME